MLSPPPPPMLAGMPPQGMPPQGMSPQGMPPQGAPGSLAHMEAFQARQYKKAQQDSHKFRKLEGNPKHGQSSQWILGIGIFTWVANVGCLGLPYWRSFVVGTFGYPRPRSWGLLAVSGQKWQWLSDMMFVACNGYADLNVGNVCFSPICLWYRLKCQKYYEFYAMSICCVAIWVWNLCWHALALSWTYTLNPRSIGRAACAWPSIFILHIAITVTWAAMTEEIFESLNMQSHYPTAPLSMCFYGAILTGAGYLVICVLACNLRGMWPEPDSSDEEFEDEDEFDSETSDERPHSRHTQGGGGPAYGYPPGAAAAAPQMAPLPGQMGGTPMAW